MFADTVSRPDVIPSATGYAVSTAISKNNGMVPLVKNPPRIQVPKRTALQYGMIPAHMKVNKAYETAAPTRRTNWIAFICPDRWSASLRENNKDHSLVTQNKCYVDNGEIVTAKEKYVLINSSHYF